jgi:2-oxoglutarate dehydrogenase E1 component
VLPEWQEYFLRSGEQAGPMRSRSLRPSFPRRSLFHLAHASLAESAVDAHCDVAQLQDHMDQMIRAYRVRGHMIANLDPLELNRTQPAE